MRKVAHFFLIAQFCYGASSDIVYQLSLRHIVETKNSGNNEVSIVSKSGVYLGLDQVAEVGGSSRLELLGPSGELIRVGHYSRFAPIAPNKLQFTQGSFLLFLHEGAPQYTIAIKGQELKFAAHGTFLCELMKNGGLKVISLSGEGNLISSPNGAFDKVRPSYVQFFLNNGDNPPAIEIDLALVVNSCPLITLFKDRLPSHLQIQKLAIRQARTIKLRSNSYVYDALSKDQVRLLVPKGKSDQEESKPKKTLKNPLTWFRNKIGI